MGSGVDAPASVGQFCRAMEWTARAVPSVMLPHWWTRMESSPVVDGANENCTRGFNGLYCLQPASRWRRGRHHGRPDSEPHV